MTFMNIPQPQIIRSHRRSIAIEITKEGELVVKAPILTPKFLIQQFLNEKAEWIKKSLTTIQKRKPVKRQYTEDEEFLFLGKVYKLKLSSGMEIALKNDILYLPKVSLFRAEKELTNWYIREAKEIITKRVVYHAEKMHTAYTSLMFSDTKSKWGTCFPDNSLQFNWRLVMAPLMVLDYVVIHELVHTTEKNHSDAFWRKVRLYTPAYRQHRKWLNDNAHVLVCRGTSNSANLTLIFLRAH